MSDKHRADLLKADEYFDSREAVAEYAVPPHLMRSEVLALKSGFPQGLVGRRILDLGCGAGRTAACLHEARADVIGVDLSPALVNVARERFPHISFEVGNAASLRFEDAAFDAVLVAKNSLDYIDSKERRMKAIREIWRVLRTDGRFVFSNHNMNAWFFKLPRLDALGFRIQQILNGNAFKSECFVPENDVSMGGRNVMTYQARSSRVIRDVSEVGFELLSVFANNPLIIFLQDHLHTHWFARVAEPMPYYVFRRRRA